MPACFVVTLAVGTTAKHVVLLCRLSLPPGHDVRCPAALLTYKMAAVTSRAGPGAAPGAAGDSGREHILAKLQPAVQKQHSPLAGHQLHVRQQQSGCELLDASPAYMTFA